MDSIDPALYSSFMRSRFLLLTAFLTLTACGNEPPKADTTPDAFTFTALTEQALNADVTSNAVNISGIDAPASASAVGGTLLVNGQAGRTSVNAGDSVSVRVHTPTEGNKTVKASVTIGGVSSDFSVTTLTPDTTPEPFTFTALTGQELNTTVTSNEITVKGINAPSKVTVQGGTLLLNGQPSTTTTVQNGDRVALKVQTASTENTASNASITIGEVTGTFTVTTRKTDRVPDTTPDAFTFTALDSQPIDTEVTSNEITVTGIDAPAPVSVTGGTLLLNGAVSTSTTVQNGEKVSLRLRTASSADTSRQATLTIGGVNATFSARTAKASTPGPVSDTTPDAFSFTALDSQPVDTEVTSNTVTISGINAPAPLTVTGGTLLLNGQPSTTSTVKNGDQVALRVRTSAQPLTPVTATLNVGGVKAEFKVTTRPASPPEPTTWNWSNPATWPDGKVPVAGQVVTLPAAKTVVLDVSPPALGGVTVPTGSTLDFARKDLTLTTEWLMVHGTLQIGTEAQPFTQQADILFTNTKPNEDVMGMGDRVLGVMDGTLELHGQKKLPWTRLSTTAPAGSTTLTLETTPDWQPGDSLTLASTDFNPNQTEQVTVQRITGTQVTLSAPLKFTHWAVSSTYAGKTLHEKAEVGLLTRNIRVGATDDASSTGLGSHIMLMGQTQARIEGVEFVRGGQRNTMRRYPVHFHMLSSQPNAYFRNNSIHESFNRCVTIHGTSDLKVQNNVTFNTVGHCIFLEDGNETGNTIDGNLVTLVRRADNQKGETPLLNSDRNPAAYWITHPANTVTNNVAAGIMDGFAFWYAFPEHPTGLSAAGGATTWNRRTALGTFSGNVAHGSYRGLNVDNGPTSDGSTTQATYYNPVSNPSDPKSAPVPAVFTNFTAYKNREHGAWLRGENLSMTNSIFADNAIGVTFAAHKSGLKDSVLIGETANVGLPENWEPKGTGGRSLPLPWDAAFPIRGFQFYDGFVNIQNTAITNFKPDSVRQASGLGYLTKNAFSLDPRNSAQSISWLDDSRRVYLQNPQADKDGDKAATFLDTDGTVTGNAGKTVTGSAILSDAPDCTRNADWNASLCAGQYTRLWLEDVTAGKIGPVTVQNNRGASVQLVGVPDEQRYFTTSVRLNENYAITPAAGSRHLRLGHVSANAGDTLNFVLPYSGDPILYRDWWIDERNRLKKVALTDLPSTTGDSYALDNGKLYLKLVVRSGAQSASVEICAAALCQ